MNLLFKILGWFYLIVGVLSFVLIPVVAVTGGGSIPELAVWGILSIAGYLLIRWALPIIK